MVVELPHDILYLICEQLQIAEDFATLFNCAVACKQLAPIALSHLYRLQKSPGGIEEAENFQELNILTQRWSIFWRSLCLSTMGGTMFPYYRYLRTLDLRDLEDLLEDPRFTGRTQTTFFANEMTPYLHRTKVISRRGRGEIWKLDLRQIVTEIGQSILSRSNLLEQVTGKISGDKFLTWIPHLPRLRSLELYYGSTLAHEPVHTAIREYCPQFEDLSIYQWTEPEADSRFSAFLTTLKPHSLKGLITISSCGVSKQTCEALSLHSQSLTKLVLTLRHEDLKALPLLKHCTNLTRLHLKFPSSAEMAPPSQNLITELASWLTDCAKLKEVTMEEFKASPAVLTPMLLSDAVQLHTIEIDARVNQYLLKDSSDFHRAIASQRNLRSLCLQGESEEASIADIETLIDTICSLTNLRKLQLRGVADDFLDNNFIRLLAPLKHLEELYIGGWSISDAVLDTFALLGNLRTLNIVATTVFTADGLLEFVSKLGPGNEGLHMSIDMADPAALIGVEEISVVREVFRTEVSGRLDYMALQDPEASDFEGESD